MPHQTGSDRRLRLLSVEHGLLCCPLVTRIQLCVVLGCGSSSVSFHPKRRPWLVLGAEPAASGQGPSTPLCLKLQLQNQATGRPATPWPMPVRLRPPPRQLVAPFWVTPGAQRGHELYLPARRASGVDCELTAGRARTPGPDTRAARAQPGQLVPGHTPPGPDPRRPSPSPHRLTPAAGHTRAG